MSIITIIVVLALLGLIVWAITTYVPMAPGFAKLIYIVAIVVAVLWLLSSFGLLADLSVMRVGKVRG